MNGGSGASRKASTCRAQYRPMAAADPAASTSATPTPAISTAWPGRTRRRASRRRSTPGDGFNIPKWQVSASAWSSNRDLTSRRTAATLRGRLPVPVNRYRTAPATAPRATILFTRNVNAARTRCQPAGRVPFRAASTSTSSSATSSMPATQGRQRRRPYTNCRAPSAGGDISAPSMATSRP